jgi:Ca2+-transporting ATPase
MHHARGHTAAVAEPANDPPPSERPTSDLAWHTHPVELVLRAFATTNAGLGSHEVARRLDRCGPNELPVLERTSAWHTLADQFKNVLILILLAATLVSGLLGHTLEAVVIAIIVAFAVTLGFLQEYRADRALEALKQMAAPLAHVIRDGGRLPGSLRRHWQMPSIT